jgi:quercetin dioxygenase-like cupin family protein
MGKTPEIVGDKADAVFCMRGAEAPVVKVEALDMMRLPQQVTAKILLPGPKASLIEFDLKKGQVFPPHRFAHDFINYVVRGNIAVTLAGEHYEAVTRDAWSGAAGVEASLEALEDSVLLEWMAPPHLVAGSRLVTWGPAHTCDSHLFARWTEIDDFQLHRVEGETDFTVRPDLKIRHRVKALVPGPHGALMWNSQEKGKWALHAHQHHFIVYLIKGAMREKFGGSIDFIAKSGDIWAAQARAVHCTEALEDNEIVEFKWPAPMIGHGIIQSWDPR